MTDTFRKEDYPNLTAYLDNISNEPKESAFERQLRRERENYEVTKELLDIRRFLK